MCGGRLGLAYSWILAAPSLLGCAAQATAPPATVSTTSDTYIGAFDASDVRIAIVRAGRKLEAYVCGTGETLENHTRWFKGALDDTDASEIPLAGWTLRVAATDTTLNGELLAPSGEIETWTADAIKHDASSEVGLYDAHQDDCRSGVIVWQAIAGPDCKAQGAWCDSTGVRGQVTPLLCIGNQPLRVQGMRDGATFDFVAKRVLEP
jgi:hypothetical protein